VTSAAALIASALAAWTASASPRRSDARNRAGAFGDVHIDGDRSPRFEYGAVAPRERFVAGFHRTRQHFGNGDCRNREAQPARRMRLEEGHESRRELRVILKNVNDRRRIDEDKRVLRQIAKI
jgi:hypothetical protein